VVEATVHVVLKVDDDALKPKRFMATRHAPSGPSVNKKPYYFTS
jgi:hypothetical protein